MRFIKISLAILLAVTFLPAFPAGAQNQTVIEPYSGSVVCAPDAEEAANCLPLGPSQTLDSWTQVGLTYPVAGLPAYAPSSEFNDMPFRYAKINADPRKEVRTFASLDDAVTTTNETGKIPAGDTRWVAYISQADVDGNHYVQLPETFEWVRASPAEITTFQGLAFYRNPDHDFGWVADRITSRVAPGLEQPATQNIYLRNNVVQIFDTQQANQEDWYQIGINEWVESRYIRKVTVNTTPPSGVTTDRWIEVNLYEQVLMIYEKGNLVFATMIATGLDPFFTQPGTFQIKQKLETERMTGAFTADKSDYYYLEKVPWTMYFDGARALHAAYWRTMFGFPQSHGCVNLAPGDAHFVFDWANEGDWVYVWDPSGKTPTDPARYGQGGA